MLTLRQIEVVRAIMIAGTVNGAAELLNVSAPGVSRTMKHTESTLGIRLFAWHRGRFVPTHEARDIFGQINQVFEKVADLKYSIAQLTRGSTSIFSFASVPSISQDVMPAAVRRLREKYPDLKMKIDVLKIEEAVDYLLLKKGELVAMSYNINHPALISHQLATARLVAIVPSGHELAARKEISLGELIRYPLVGIDPDDPFGRIIATAFRDNGFEYTLSIQARFAHTVHSLVRHGLGVAVIDEFSVSARDLPGVVRLAITEPTSLTTYALVHADEPQTIFAETLIGLLRERMARALEGRTWG
ncbi:MAG: LysR family transcriptional regulator [Rhodospirillales bacterium]|nr:LysR family transcriptional regulator [Rhodospirillales bacterium]